MNSVCIFSSHLVDSYEAHGRTICFDFNLEFPPTVTLSSEFATDSDYSFKLHLCKTLQLILRYQHRFFAADHFLSAALPSIDAQRVAEVGREIELLSDLFFGLTFDGASPSFC